MCTEKQIRDGAQAFVEHMLKQTVRLLGVVEKDEEEKIFPAAGVIVEEEGRHRVLSVAHAVGDGNWLLEADYFEGDRTTLMLRLQDTVVFETSQHDGRQDVAWCYVDVKKRTAASADDERLAKATVPVYRGPLDRTPQDDIAYGFAKHARDEPHPAINRMYTEPVFEVGMQFIGVDDRGYYKFRVRGKHKGKDVYGGCSGSPIAGDDGIIVALVQGGCEDDGIIYGVPISLYQTKELDA